RFHQLPDVTQFSAGEDILANQAMFRPTAAEGAVRLGSATDHLNQQSPAITHHAEHALQQRRIVVDADVLEHAEAGNLVVGALHQESVPQFDRAPAFQTQLAPPGANVVQLLLR